MPPEPFKDRIQQCKSQISGQRDDDQRPDFPLLGAVEKGGDDFGGQPQIDERADAGE